MEELLERATPEVEKGHLRAERKAATAAGRRAITIVGAAGKAVAAPVAVVIVGAVTAAAIAGAAVTAGATMAGTEGVAEAIGDMTIPVAVGIARAMTATDMVVVAAIIGGTRTTACHVERCSAEVTELLATGNTGGTTTVATAAAAGKIERH
jgi:hypothetical protein